MTKLNQVIAVEPSVKTKADRDSTSIYHDLQKSVLFNGLSRTYQKKDDDGDDLPPESTPVQRSAEEEIERLGDVLERLFDITLTKEVANASAKADVVVNETTILSDVPVTYLLFLEKQLVHLHTIVKAAPVLDPTLEWTRDDTSGIYKAAPVQTVKTKKVPKNWVKAPATDKHPAQVEIFHEDVVVGYWTKVDSSGAFPAVRKAGLLSRIEALQSAVKFAREEANSVEVADLHESRRVFNWLFS